MTDVMQNLIDRCKALAEFPGIFVPSDDDVTDDEANRVWNEFIDAVDLAEAS